MPLPAINYVSQPVRQLDDTRFDIRLDQTFSEKDNAFGRFSYDQAFSFVPGGSPGFAEANAFGSNQRIRNHARNIGLGETHVFNANMVNQATFGYNRIFDYISSQGTGTCISTTIGGGIPNANLGCAGSTACPAPTAADWFRPSSRAAIGPSAIVATLRSRVEPTSSLSGTPSITSTISTTSGLGSTIAPIK